MEYKDSNIEYIPGQFYLIHSNYSEFAQVAMFESFSSLSDHAILIDLYYSDGVVPTVMFRSEIEHIEYCPELFKEVYCYDGEL